MAPNMMRRETRPAGAMKCLVLKSAYEYKSNPLRVSNSSPGVVSGFRTFAVDSIGSAVQLATLGV